MEILSVAYLLVIVCAYHVMEAAPLGHKLTFSDDDLKCIKDLKLDKNYIESIITSSRFPPEDDPQFNEYFHCHWKVRGIQNDDGTINFYKIVEAIQRIPRNRFDEKYTDDTPVGLEIATVAVENCKNIPKGESDGQTAVQVHNCIEKRVIDLVKKD